MRGFPRGGRWPVSLPSRRLVAIAMIAAGVLIPAGARSQNASRLFPDRSLVPALLAGSRDPVVKGQLVYTPVDPTRYGRGVSGDVSLAATIPVLLLAGKPGGDALALGMEAAVFARFSFHLIQRELVNTDWIFAVPLVWHRGGHWVRLRYYHTSSHLGDEYSERFSLAPINFSRDGADLTGYYRPWPGLGLYGLAFLSVNAHPVRAHGSHVRTGVEFDPGGGQAWRLFAAADLHLETSAAPDPRLASQVGVWLPPVSGRPFRLALGLTMGPAPMGQFNGVETTQVALGLFWNP